jgi:predicted O-methyltransferase YrrM
MLPTSVFRGLKGVKVAVTRSLVRLLIRLGLNVQRTNDYYSVLPVVTDLERTRARWERASELVGIECDLDEFRSWYIECRNAWLAEAKELPTVSQLAAEGFGVGYVQGDATIHYGLIRTKKPKRIIEVGSGISTRVSWLAAQRNAAEGHPVELHCVEPYPYPKLRQMADIQMQVAPVQDVPLDFFSQLDAGDILFIDSTHTFKIDSDVSYLFLEVLPRLKKGVLIHVHDIVLPFNYPYPADVAIFNRDWPFFWNEALALQALLCGSSLFRLRLSMTLLRHKDAAGFRALLPDPVTMENDFCAVWIEKIA